MPSRLCSYIRGELMIRTYSELIQLPTFEERFKYLQLNGTVGKETFGYDRYLNQLFYNSSHWRKRRDDIIKRDLGCDLAVVGFELQDRVYIHHMNPIRIDDLLEQSEYLMEPEYLICTSFNTHQAIHYGDESLLVGTLIERTPNDTCPWKH